MTAEDKSIPSSACETCPVHHSANLLKLGVDMTDWDFVVALTGNPNTGKSTVFNALTGLRQHTGNWPGKTVTRAEGGFEFDRQQFKLVDLPGTYSLLSMSLDEEIARHKRFTTPLVLAVWDVDHFKKVNDRFGHRAGDKVLRTIAAALRDGIRETDFLARYGGEEFVLLMTGSALDECLPVAERLRSAVAATGFHFRGQAVTITASCGLAEFDKAETVEQWFERADKALYRAKQSGRNRCEVSKS